MISTPCTPGSSVLSWHECHAQGTFSADVQPDPPGAGLNIGGQTGFNTNLLLGEKSISARSSMAFTPCPIRSAPVHESPARCFPVRQLRLHGRNMPARITCAVEMRKEQTSREPSSSPAKSSAVIWSRWAKKAPALADRRLRRRSGS